MPTNVGLHLDKPIYPITSFKCLQVNEYNKTSIQHKSLQLHQEHREGIEKLFISLV